MATVALRLGVHSLKEKRLELSTPNGIHVILYDRTSARSDFEVKRSEIAGYEACCRRGYACRRDCLGFYSRYLRRIVGDETLTTFESGPRGFPSRLTECIIVLARALDRKHSVQKCQYVYVRTVARRECLPRSGPGRRAGWRALGIII